MRITGNNRSPRTLEVLYAQYVRPVKKFASQPRNSEFNADARHLLQMSLFMTQIPRALRVKIVRKKL